MRTEDPPIVALPDYPSVLAERETASVELDRLATLGEIHWYSEGSYLPDLRARPSHLVVKTDKVRVVRNWPNVLFPLNSTLVNPPVDYGAMDGFRGLLRPGAFMGAIDLQGCFLRWLVSPSCRRRVGVRRPVGGIWGTFLFLPFGLGLSPGRNDACVKAGLKVVRFPLLRIVGLADDLRSVDGSGERDVLAAGTAGALSPLEDMGVRFHTIEGKRWWPTRRIPWLGFEVDSKANVAELEVRKVQKSSRLCEELFEASPGSRVSARSLLATVPFSNFLEWVIPVGFRHLRSGWGAADESGIMDQWMSGSKRANMDAVLSEQLRSDVLWWRKMLSALPSKTTQYGREGGFARHPRLPSLRRRALSLGPGAVGTVYTDASSKRGRGTSHGDQFIQGQRAKLERRGGISWQELWVLRAALEAWGDSPASKLVLVRIGNSTSVWYANNSAGRIPRFTQLARSIEDLEVSLRRTAAPLHIAGRRNSIADALSRFTIRGRGLGPRPNRGLRDNYRIEVIDRCGDIDVDVLACDDGSNARVPYYRCPIESSLRGPATVRPTLAVSQDRHGGSRPFFGRLRP